MDIVITLGKSLIQHGFFNDRIYLMKIHPDDAGIISQRITDLLTNYNYAKIVMKIPESLENLFKSAGTVQEARIPGFYQGNEDTLFLSQFIDTARAQDDAYDQIQKNIQISREKTSSPSLIIEPLEWTIRKATIDDISQICALYQRTFETYPFPIQEPDYLKKIMNGGVQFFVGETSDGIIAAGSCEIDRYASAVEMSDLAIDAAYKGLGLSKQLLSYQEQQMKEEGIKTTYTICRGEPLPVNRLFARAQYQYGGTLINNTNICGKIESMNVWYKTLC
ncbi:putative beta-lysine N-acetyltransferase [Methanosphaerula subterraneus]|uniref:putative beta-lysine N-acetyltransferase n=1 Tax=Methanosphaerula subterraneus TaxID=3350244 RepID=UPI003F835941